MIENDVVSRRDCLLYHSPVGRRRILIIKADSLNEVSGILVMRPLQMEAWAYGALVSQTNLEGINCDGRGDDSDPGVAVDHAVPKAELVAGSSASGSLPRHDGHDEEVGEQTHGPRRHQEHHEDLL